MDNSSTNFITQKWTEIESFENGKYKNLIYNIHTQNIPKGGGLMWINYNSTHPSEKPGFLYVTINSDKWDHVKTLVPLSSWEIAIKEYDCKKHLIMFMTAGGSSQIVRVNSWF